MTRCGTLDIELRHGDEPADQAKYLVHGFDDIFWTDDIDAAVAYLKESLLAMEKACSLNKTKKAKQ